MNTPNRTTPAIDARLRRRPPAWLLALCAALAMPGTVHGAGNPPTALAERERHTASLRPVALSMPQSEMEISVEIGRVMNDSYGGGLIGAAIIASRDNKREVMTEHAEQRAASEVQPIVDSLAGFDIDALAIAAGRKAIAEVDWFKPGPIEMTGIPGAPGFREFVADNPAQQVGRITYRYQMSPDFTQLQVIADIAILRADDLTPIYGQQVVSVVQLRQRSYDHADNVRRWSQADGALIKAGLKSAFARLGAVLPVVMDLDPAGFAEATGKKREAAFAAGFHGPILLRDAEGPVIWEKKIGFIAVQPAGD